MSTSGTIHEGNMPRQPMLARLIIGLPNWGLRILLWILARVIYRIKILGRENIPQKGGALLVSNHLSFVDVVLISVAANRPIRFLIFKDVYDNPLIKPFAMLLRAIPISPELRPRDIIHSLREASDAIRAGDLVCVFAEGQITRTGQMLPFGRGMERISKGLTQPIVPVNLHGVWGSIFSFERERFLWKMPRRMPYPVTVSFGKWLPSSTKAAEVRRAVQELHAAAFEADRAPSRTLDRILIRTARRYPWRFAMGDARFPQVSFAGMLLKLMFVTRRLRSQWGDQNMVGVLLPPSVGGALVNLSAAMLGKVAVNLNYTASSEALASCAEQCKLETVVTSKLLHGEAGRHQQNCGSCPHHFSGRRTGSAAQFRKDHRTPSGVRNALSPCMKRMLGARKQTTDDLATIIFSSGSTGDPKGVMLTHHNMLANIRQMTQVFSFTSEDRILGILPFFHAFGFTVTLWLAVDLWRWRGVSSQPAGIADHRRTWSRKYKVTFLIATPTFLQAYMRRCSREDFASLRCVLVGAEKLPERVAHAFEDHFGIRPLEGYGVHRMRTRRRREHLRLPRTRRPSGGRRGWEPLAIRCRASACALLIPTRDSRCPRQLRACCW